MSYNVHGLLHLSDDSVKFGSLDNFSCYMFENFLKILKSKLRKSEKPLQQLHRRYEELNNFRLDHKTCLQKLHNNGPCAFNIQREYLIYRTENFVLTTVFPNNIYLIDKSVVKILNFGITADGLAVVLGNKYLNIEELYSKPSSSLFLDIMKISNLSESLEIWPINKISNKMLCIT